MNICIYGAGAIGSLFASFLANHHSVFCIGRRHQVDASNKFGLTITGKTEFNKKIPFYTTMDELPITPDLVILTVKAFDTKQAAEDIFRIINKKTILMSLQNGIGNIEKICSIMPEKQVIAAITSHGSLFLQSGIIKHTGVGKTLIGELDGSLSKRIRMIHEILYKTQIMIDISTNIQRDIWKKAIVNASINPLTSIFQCKNGYLLENPVLSALVHKICEESTTIANSIGYGLDGEEMMKYTLDVITDTKQNTSSMLQSILQKKKTELFEINGAIFKEAKKHHYPSPLNEMIINIIPLMYASR